MDSKKKLIYGVIIAVCLVGSAIVLLWGGGGNVPSLPTDNLTAPVGNSTAPSTSTKAKLQQSIDGTYPAPAVFPTNTKIDTSLFSSTDFQVLKPYDNLHLEDGELGRDDPFADY